MLTVNVVPDNGPAHIVTVSLPLMYGVCVAEIVQTLDAGTVTGTDPAPELIDVTVHANPQGTPDEALHVLCAKDDMTPKAPMVPLISTFPGWAVGGRGPDVFCAMTAGPPHDDG
jgi:hypothetical protein